MTKHANRSLKTILAALTLGATISGWAMLARQMTAQKPDVATVSSTPTQSAVEQSVAVTLPPVPTVEALRAYASASTGSGTNLDLPPVPVVVEPAPRSQSAQPPAQAPQAPPTIITGSSK